MMHRAGSPTPSGHAQHDELLMAQLAGDDLNDSERRTAEARLADCADCRRLHDDLRALMRATADLPVPRRPRDFRLSADEAAGLRGSWLQRALRGLAAPTLGLLQPVAGVAMVLGLAIVVVGATPFFQGAGAAMPMGAPAERQRMAAESTTDALGGVEEAAPGAASSSPRSNYDTSAGGIRSPAATVMQAPGEGQSTTTGEGAAQASQLVGVATDAPDEAVETLQLQQEGGISSGEWLLIGGLVFAGGLFLFVARTVALRQMEDPRLR